MNFSFREIVDLLMKRLILIIICTFSGMCIFYIVNQFIIRPAYTASVQMYVNADAAASSADLNELYYAQKVVSTYINFLQTKVFYSKVIEESGLDYSPEQLKKMTEIKAVNNTEIFQINVTSYSAQDSFRLVQAMQTISPDLIHSIKDNTEISVVDPAALPDSPSGPNIPVNTIAGGFLGFILSILASFLWELIDVNVKNEEELIRKYQKPILGSIPNYNTGKKRKNRLVKFLPKRWKQKKRKREDKAINDDTRFMITEAYKALRTNLRYTLRKDGCRKILVNSPVPEDGKSTTCSNIGITIAQTGARVLLIDCDLRKGRLHGFFSLKSSPGISDILSGMMDVENVIQKTSYANLQVLTMGSIPPNPTELLASIQMEELLRHLEKNYDYIVIDSPPVNVVSDALSLVKQVDGIVIVVRENHTSHPNIANAITKYEFIEPKILGFVLNGTSLNQGHQSKSKYYYYRKYSND